jgi:hypothetical protein
MTIYFPSAYDMTSEPVNLRDPVNRPRGGNVRGSSLEHPASDREAQQRAVETDQTTNERAMHERIAVAAYFLAERRDFAPGSEVEDWLRAERELQEMGTKP